MRSRWLKWTVAVSGLGLAGTAAAFYVLVTPSNPLTMQFRGTITAADAQVIIGPYPLPEDFRVLAEQGVETIVSLLDPRLPYEGVLLERERTMAAEHGMTVLSHPMASVLGQQFGSDHDERVQAAAAAIIGLSGKVFVHCYLGVHRAKSVADAVAAMNVETDRYHAREGERTPEAYALDAAQAHYQNGRNDEAAAVLARLEAPGLKAVLLHGWTLYRMQDVSGACERFADALELDPQSRGAWVGLGYCSLRLSHLAEAESYFEQALEASATDVDALMGIGLVRYRQGRHAEAAPHLRAVLEHAPDYEEARSILARIDA